MIYSDDYASYLPAVQSNYVGFDTSKSRLGWYDDTIHNFLKDNGGLYYPRALYSAGHAELDTVISRQKDLLVHDRSKDSIMVADSGGYQWTTGAWETDWSDWRDIENIRHSVLRWQESGFDYAITLDMPTYAIDNPSVPFSSMQECLDFTKENLDFIRDHRTGGVKFLNVLQGRSEQEADAWLNGVWEYPFEGWAIAGTSAGDVELLLRRLIKLRDSHLLSDRDWVHILGVGTLTAACVFTECQNQLRETTNENLTISFDTSSPSMNAVKGGMYGFRDLRDASSILKFSSRYYEAPSKRGYAQDDRTLFKYMQQFGETEKTLISGNLQLDELCKRRGKIWDTLSYYMITNHNYEVMFRMMRQANDLYMCGQHLPIELDYFKNEVAPDIFSSERPMTAIKRHARSLKRLRLKRSIYEPEPHPLFTDMPKPDHQPVWS